MLIKCMNVHLGSWQDLPHKLQQARCDRTGTQAASHLDLCSCIFLLLRGVLGLAIPTGLLQGVNTKC